MAKPGSNEARELSALAQKATMVGGSVPEQLAAKLLTEVEGKLGMRCGGCHRRITIGVQFTRLDIVLGPDGSPQADVRRLSACTREDCDFAIEARDNATVMEMIEYQWLDGPEEEETAPVHDGSPG